MRAALWWLWFYCRTRCTERWLERMWTQLIERDIHPDDDLLLVCPNGDELHVSAFGSQLWCRYDWGYQFCVNWSDLSYLYVDEKYGDGDWKRVYNQRARVLRATSWVRTMKMLASNLDRIEDRSDENTTDYTGGKA